MESAPGGAEERYVARSEVSHLAASMESAPGGAEEER